MSLSHNLKVIRSKYRISQEAFGELVFATRQMINTYEQETAMPSIEFILRLSSLTGIPADFLFYKKIREEDLPEQFNEVGEPSVLYQRSNLYDIRDLVQEVERIRKELDELKKKG